MKSDYFRENIANMDGYVPGFQPTGPGWTKLNTNENPFPPPPEVMQALSNVAGEKMAMYPPPQSALVREKYAKAYGLGPEMVFAGNGSDEILAIITRCFLDSGSAQVITDPTYSLYDVLADIQDAKTIKLPVGDDFSLPEEIFSRSEKLVIVSNPNPPSGVLYSVDEMERLCCESSGIVVIDEAYVDFSRWNCLDLVKKHDNLIVTRTFSKSFSLAGLRIGFAIAQKPLIDGMMKVKDSYNLNLLSQVAAAAAIDNIDYFTENVKKVVAERERLSSMLSEIGWKVFPSEANFILVEPKGVEARAVYEGLLGMKILVRFFDKPGLDGYLRITIGKREQSDKLVAAIWKLQ
jgi:histidinol-phosphate aminotransferase